MIRARTSGTGPLSPSAIRGATTHESRPIGIAAAAQTTRTARADSCGIERSAAIGTAMGGAARDGTAVADTADLRVGWRVCKLGARRAGVVVRRSLAPRADGTTRGPPRGGGDRRVPGVRSAGEPDRPNRSRARRRRGDRPGRGRERGGGRAPADAGPDPVAGGPGGRDRGADAARSPPLPLRRAG